MSDKLRLLQAFRDAGSTGLHSHDIRRAGLSGNPAQRVIELRLEGHVIEGEVEWRNGRNGKRWTLTHDAAAPVGAKRNPDSLVQNAGRDRGAEGPPSLFEAPHEPRSAALYDYEDAA